MNNYFHRAPAIDLPADIVTDLLKSIEQNNIEGSWFRMDRNCGKSWFKRMVLGYFFRKGFFQCFRIGTDLEYRIYKHLHKFIDTVGQQPKIRFKVTHNVRKLMPHSDAADGGDYSSVVVLIKGNNEVTTWYNAGRECHSSFKELLSLTPVENAQFEPQVSYLFNNEQVHGVSNCQPEQTRYLLSISWQSVTYDQVVDAYKKYERYKNN